MAPLPQRPRPALLAPQPLARRSTGSWRPTTSTSRGRTPAACSRIGVLDADELARDRRRPGAGRAPAWPSTASSSRTPTRTSTWRSSGCSARRSGRWPASSTPAARATTRSRPTWRWSSRPTRCGRSSSAARRWSELLRAGRGPPRLADARLHPPAARPAGLPRPPPARLLLDARPRRPPLPVRARQRQRDAARLRRPGRGQLGDRPRGGRRRPRLRPRQPQLDRRRLQPRLRPRLPGRRLDLLDAPLAAGLGNRHLVEHRVRLLPSSTSPSPRAPRSCRRS